MEEYAWIEFIQNCWKIIQVNIKFSLFCSDSVSISALSIGYALSSVLWSARISSNRRICGVEGTLKIHQFFSSRGRSPLGNFLALLLGFFWRPVRIGVSPLTRSLFILRYSLIHLVVNILLGNRELNSLNIRYLLLYICLRIGQIPRNR